MRVFVFLAVAAAIGLSAIPQTARAGGTNLVYTYGGHFDLPIPDDPAVTKGWMKDAVVSVPEHLIICDLDVSVSIRHTAAFDLWLFLRSPGGKVTWLSVSDAITGYFDGGDYSGTIFDDEAGIRIEDGKPPFTGRHRPAQPLAFFDGQDAHGLWSLQVYDAFHRDTGRLDFFSLSITVSPPKVVAAVPVPAAGGLALLGLVLLGPRIGNLVRIRNRAIQPGEMVTRASR